MVNVVECALESLSHRELVVECLRLEKQVQLLRKTIKSLFRIDFCGDLRPKRDVLCQNVKGHGGRHRAVIFWE
jgi:hypothetical protein